MSKLAEYLGKVDFRDKNFIGTIALRSEEITLSDGSKMALGIDDGHWVLVYQKAAGNAFQVFECDWHQHKIVVDKKLGGEAEFKEFKNLLKNFFSTAETDNLVTILPMQG